MSKIIFIFIFIIKRRTFFELYINNIKFQSYLKSCLIKVCLRIFAKYLPSKMMNFTQDRHLYKISQKALENKAEPNISVLIIIYRKENILDSSILISKLAITPKTKFN